MRPLVYLMQQDSDFQSTVTGIQQGMTEQWVSGLTGTARILYVASLLETLKRPLLFVTHNLNQAQKALEDFQEILPNQEILLYSADELITTEVALTGRETYSERIQVLSRLAQGFSGILITPFSGLRKLLVPREIFADHHLTLNVGKVYEVDRLLRHLVMVGYERVDMVEKKGEFAVRGGIVDIYPVSSEYPVRIEWFDDEIDSIRSFSVSDQRSREMKQHTLISPAKELFASSDQLSEASLQLQALLEKRLQNVKKAAYKQQLVEHVGKDIEHLKQGIHFTGVYKYISLIYPQYESLLDYMSKDTMMVFDEPSRIIESAKHLEREEGDWQTTLLEQAEFLPGLPISKSYDELFSEISQPRIYLSLFMRQIAGLQPQNLVQFMCKGMQQFHGQMHVLKAEWDRFVKAGYRVVFVASNQERMERLKRILLDYGMEASLNHTFQLLPPGKPILQIASLTSGFEMTSLRLAVITEGEVFTQKGRRVRRSVKMDHAEKIKDYQELKPGDYVVHVNHGIGRYAGIETLKVGGLHKDYLLVHYAGNDKLYVPVEQIDQVQKYIGGEERTPKVYSLGGSEWSKVKNRVRSSVQDIAQELIILYAKRQEAKGYSFSEDTTYQKEFEVMFPYEETPDQLRSIEEIKADMQQVQPMDRLLCGDVGYGKTEVAIRSAFKAAMDGKQVAVLVPTTILAQQHYETFRERFAGFPVEIDVLSRFRSRKEQKVTLEKLKEGTVDVIIGTHRLLSKDVTFKDLGLLIIDEEQRFGVKHKEKIKQLKHNIDVLTLTATPIPRTLHMGMIGVRDLSVIETPPENRFPVQTYVLEYSGILVREAIEREMARGGQVYFLYNQVHNIDQMAERIRLYVPEARIAVAHGKMAETQLEKIMLDFLDGEYDVLVSTTIIESGVDIPNVNTLIIYNADKMGLSQLYQLRGRVGRSNRIAYAYFTYQRDKVLSEAAEKRLQAIKEFTELGSGFKIAMRDLSIRGAGNLLGAEQHGHIATVGFELYSQMLKEAVSELQGKKEVVEAFEPQIELSVDAYLPSDYIQDEKQKIELYKKIKAVTTQEEVKSLEEEMEDRFGELPESVQSLIRVARIRAYAIQYRIEQIEQKGMEIIMRFHPSENHQVDGQQLFRVAQNFPGRVRLSSGQRIGIHFRGRGLSAQAILEIMEKFLIQYESVPKKKGEIQNAVID